MLDQHERHFLRQGIDDLEDLLAFAFRHAGAGSSSSSTFGFGATAMAISSRRCLP